MIPRSSSALSGAWGRLTRRERVMVAIMGLAVAGLVLWLGFRGLSDWRDEAQRRFQRAGADHAAILAAARWAEGRRGTPAPDGLEAEARRLAQDQGLTLAAVTPEPDGVLTLDIEAGASTAIFAWLANLEARGVAIRAFSAVPGPDGGLQARATLTPPA